MTDDDQISERLDRLESMLDQQQETIAAQQATIDTQQSTIDTQQSVIDQQQAQLSELAAQPISGTLGDGTSPPISRRTALRAGGALALLGLGAGSAVAEPQPQGQVGTEDQPLTALHTVDLEATEITAENDASGGWGVRGVNTGSGYGIYSDGDSRTDGDHETTGDTEIGGELSFGDGSAQQTAGPIAKGYIDSSEENSFGDPLPTVENGVNIDNVTWFWGDEVNASSACEITLSGIHYRSEEYATFVAPHHVLGEPPAIPTVFANQGGDLRIRFEDPDENIVHPSFQFVTYALPDGTETTMGSIGAPTLNAADGRRLHGPDL